MQRYNIIVVMDETDSRVLMCRRRKPPYAGLLSFVGGKVEKFLTTIADSKKLYSVKTASGKILCFRMQFKYMT